MQHPMGPASEFRGISRYRSKRTNVKKLSACKQGNGLSTSLHSGEVGYWLPSSRINKQSYGSHDSLLRTSPRLRCCQVPEMGSAKIQERRPPSWSTNEIRRRSHGHWKMP